MHTKITCSRKSESAFCSDRRIVAASGFNRQASQDDTRLVTAALRDRRVVPAGVPRRNEAWVVDGFEGRHRALHKAEILKRRISECGAVLRLGQIHRPSQALTLHRLELKGDSVVDETRDVRHCLADVKSSREKHGEKTMM